MKQINYLILFITSCAFGQTELKEYTTKCGYFIKTNDTLALGVALHNNYSFVSQLVGLEFLPKEKVTLTKDLQGEQVIVQKIKVENTLINVIGKIIRSKNTKLCIDLENSLRSGEVITRQSMYWKSRNYKPLDQEAFLLYIKLTKGSPKEFASEYTYRYRSEEYVKNKNDEFEFGKILEQNEKNITEKIDSLKMEAIYSLALTSDLGEYDFESGGFPIATQPYLDWLEPW